MGPDFSRNSGAAQISTWKSSSLRAISVEIFEPGDADGDVEAFLDQIDETVVGDDFEREFGMLLAEIDQRLADVGIDEGARRGDA